LLVADLPRLGEVLLLHLKSYEGGKTVHQPIGKFNRLYCFQMMEGTARGFGPTSTQAEYGDRQPQVTARMQEAWNWLVTNGYLMHNPDQPSPDWFVVTTEGEKLLARLNGKEPSGDLQDHNLRNVHQNPVASFRNLSRKVFVAHGHDEGAREKIARFLERLDFAPIILHEQASRGRTVIEKVEDHSDVGFAVVLLTPDDEGCKRGGTPQPRARQNVVLELGYFVGRLGRAHVCALKRGDDLEIPSDFEGVLYLPFDSSDGWKLGLGRELQAAGFQIDWDKAIGASV
jgi:predicted nucleotide-binding protein